MAKIVQLIAHVDTYVKNEQGKKVKVKTGEDFKTDSKTAETYLRVYPRYFTEANPEETGGVDNIATDNRVNDLEAQVEDLKAINEKLENELIERDLEILRVKHEGIPLAEIDYNDLLKIASLKWVELTNGKKREDVIKALEDHEESQKAQA